MTDIITLNGVGPALAKTLKDHGLLTVEAVAAAPLEDLKAIPGIGAARAMRLKQAAAGEGVAAGPAGSARSKPTASRPARTTKAGAIKKPLPAKSKAKVEVEKPSGNKRVEAKGPTVSEAEEALSTALAAAEAARKAAEQKAAKAKAKAKKAARQAEALMEEFAKAKDKARTKAKKMKAEARRAIEREKAKAKAILEEMAQKAKEPEKVKEKTKGKSAKSASKASSSKSGEKKKAKKAAKK